MQAKKLKQQTELKGVGPLFMVSIYPYMEQIFSRHGYKLAAANNSDLEFHLLAVPWGDKVSRPDKPLLDLQSRFTIVIEKERGTKNHGRTDYSIITNLAFCSFTVSFFPPHE